MPGNGTRASFEAEEYEASLRQKLIHTVVTPCGRSSRHYQPSFDWASVPLGTMQPR